MNRLTQFTSYVRYLLAGTIPTLLPVREIRLILDLLHRLKSVKKSYFNKRFEFYVFFKLIISIRIIMIIIYLMTGSKGKDKGRDLNKSWRMAHFKPN